MTDITDLAGRVSLVTGAGQGVGRQIALQLGAALNSGGVVVNDYVLERAETVAEEIRAAGGKALALQCDVSDHSAVKAMAERAASELGPIGVLVNNAGNAGANPSPELGKPFWETGPEVWYSFLGVNLYGVMNCTAAVIPGMIARGAPGRIVTIISDASRWGDAGLEIYAAGKAGAAGFMRSGPVPRPLRDHRQQRRHRPHRHPRRPTHPARRPRAPQAPDGTLHHPPPRPAHRHRQHGAVPGLGRLELDHGAGVSGEWGVHVGFVSQDQSTTSTNSQL